MLRGEIDLDDRELTQAYDRELTQAYYYPAGNGQTEVRYAWNTEPFFTTVNTTTATNRWDVAYAGTTIDAGLPDVAWMEDTLNEIRRRASDFGIPQVDLDPEPEIPAVTGEELAALYGGDEADWSDDN